MMKIIPTSRSTAKVQVVCCVIAGALCLAAGARAPGQPANSQAARPRLAIGAPAPDFDLPGVDGKNHRLRDFAGAKVLAVVMEDDHSPTSQLYEDRIRRLYDEYKGNGLAVVAISPDAPEAVPYDKMDHTDVGDKLQEMKLTAPYRHIDWPFLYDGDKQSIATALGASVTPEIFIFDQERKLRYRGRIDDNIDGSQVTSRDAQTAIDELLAGKPVTVDSTDAAGSRIYWATDKSAAQAERSKLEEEPITVSLTSKEELAKLRNNPTGKYLMVNFWATWCGPCVGEFPDLQDTYRMYRDRGFTFITVSENDPAEKAAVLDFLRNQHATTQNILFSDSDVYTMQAAFDPNMPGSVPVTLLFTPSSDVLYQQVGDLDTMKLRHAILSNLPDTQDYPGEQKYWSGLAAGEPSKR